MAKPWPVSARIHGEVIPAVAAASLRAPWDDLAARALEANAFYAASTALSGLFHLPEGRGARLALAWRGEGETRRLVGLLPLARPRGRYFNPAPMVRAAAFYGTLSTPLLDPDRPEETWAALLSACAADGIRAVLLPFLHEEGPVAAALAGACTTASLPSVRLAGHRRAMLSSPLPASQYVRETLDAKRRKEADRKRRRLAEDGALAFSVARTPAEVAPALDAFLAIEAAGWKGRAGTALRRAPGGERFMAEAARMGAEAGTFRVAALSLDGRPIAAGLVSVAGTRAFYCKTAYDETLARSSPGFLLTLDLTAHLLDDPAIVDADSIAVADHPMIDRIWTARFPVATLLVGTKPGGSASFRAAVALERAREGAIGWIKAKRAQFRRSRSPDGNDAGK